MEENILAFSPQGAVKKCAGCRKTKPATLDFFGFVKYKDRKRCCSYCRICSIKKSNQFRKNNKKKVKFWGKRYRQAHPGMQKEASRKWKLKNKYGLTLEQAAILLSRGCEVCGDHNKLGLDHCHTTNKFRGVLCSHCNFSLGSLRENLDRVEKLKQYIILKCNPLKVSP